MSGFETLRFDLNILSDSIWTTVKLWNCLLTCLPIQNAVTWTVKPLLQCWAAVSDTVIDNLLTVCIIPTTMTKQCMEYGCPLFNKKSKILRFCERFEISFEICL